MTSIATASLDTHAILGIVNGAIFIVVAALTICLVSYVRTLVRTFNLSIMDVIFRSTPLGVRLALPMITLKTGALLALSMAWGWRVFGSPATMPDWVVIVLLTGITILIEGSLWLIRVLTMFRYGEWPWLVTAALTIVYVSASVVWHVIA